MAKFKAILQTRFDLVIEIKVHRDVSAGIGGRDHLCTGHREFRIIHQRFELIGQIPERFSGLGQLDLAGVSGGIGLLNLHSRHIRLLAMKQDISGLLGCFDEPFERGDILLGLNELPIDFLDLENRVFNFLAEVQQADTLIILRDGDSARFTSTPKFCSNGWVIVRTRSVS